MIDRHSGSGRFTQSGFTVLILLIFLATMVFNAAVFQAGYSQAVRDDEQEDVIAVLQRGQYERALGTCAQELETVVYLSRNLLYAVDRQDKARYDWAAANLDVALRELR